MSVLYDLTLPLLGTFIRNKHVCTNTARCRAKDALRIIVDDTPKLEATQMSTNSRMAKQSMVEI